MLPIQSGPIESYAIRTLPLLPILSFALSYGTVHALRFASEPLLPVRYDPSIPFASMHFRSESCRYFPPRSMMSKRPSSPLFSGRHSHSPTLSPARRIK